MYLVRQACRVPIVFTDCHRKDEYCHMVLCYQLGYQHQVHLRPLSPHQVSSKRLHLRTLELEREREQV